MAESEGGGVPYWMQSMSSPATVTVCGVAVVVTIVPVRAGSEDVVFPKDYAAGVMYTSHDLADAKEYREFYVTPPALDATRKDQPLPSGTVITLARYDVQLDPSGNPLKDGNGCFVKTELKALRVMEK